MELPGYRAERQGTFFTFYFRVVLTSCVSRMQTMLVILRVAQHRLRKADFRLLSPIYHSGIPRCTQ